MNNYNKKYNFSTLIKGNSNFDNISKTSLISHFLVLVVVIVFLSSCKKYVEINPPITRLVSETVFSNNAAATASVTSIYSQMMNKFTLASGCFPVAMSKFTGLSSDELKNYSSQTSDIQFYQNSLNAISNGYITPYMWSPLYSYIYQSNAAIEGLETSLAIDFKIKQQLIGEAKFIRGFCYFYLVNLFGDVPLILTTNYQINFSLPRSPKDQVYSQIINDLKDAQNLLNSNYVDVSDTVPTGERVRPNKSVASALLARVYLYTGDWANAENQANIILSNKTLYDTVPLNKVFLKNSKEAIWQLMPTPASTVNTSEGYQFILNTTPQASGTRSTTISPQLLNAFEVGDNRRTNWINNISVGINTYYYPYKYKVQTGSVKTEYSMVLRLGEQYLIRAEARAQQGNLNGSVADLNIIRNRAGLNNYAGSLDKNLILNAILHERQVELFTEWGHRWFDLKRYAYINSVMLLVAPAKGGTWNSNLQLYPIPNSEILNDPNLVQNEGY
jgi:starch-binding outer membrane protein, SusD/RagB family